MSAKRACHETSSRSQLACNKRVCFQNPRLKKLFESWALSTEEVDHSRRFWFKSHWFSAPIGGWTADLWRNDWRRLCRCFLTQNITKSNKSKRSLSMTSRLCRHQNHRIAIGLYTSLLLVYSPTVVGHCQLSQLVTTQYSWLSYQNFPANKHYPSPLFVIIDSSMLLASEVCCYQKPTI